MVIGLIRSPLYTFGKGHEKPAQTQQHSTGEDKTLNEQLELASYVTSVCSIWVTINLNTFQRRLETAPDIQP